VIDGVDGRTHYVETADASPLDEIRRGHIVSLDPAPTKAEPRAADRNIRDWAVTHGGIYRPSEHLEAARPGIERFKGDPDAFIRSHVRRLEALRRAGHVERVGKQMAAERGLTYAPSGPGEYVTGRLAGVATLASGRFAMIEDGLGFQLVPWQPVLENRLDQYISGVRRDDGGVEWGFGRKRQLGLGL
jgi:uncharacterized protein DUF3363